MKATDLVAGMVNSLPLDTAPAEISRLASLAAGAVIDQLREPDSDTGELSRLAMKAPHAVRELFQSRQLAALRES